MIETRYFTTEELLNISHYQVGNKQARYFPNKTCEQFHQGEEEKSHVLDARILSMLMLSFGSMSSRKLQKLCYYMYSWYLGINGKPVADVQFEAWVHGPVSRRIYLLYQRYGWENIPSHKVFLPVSDDVIAFAERVWGFYSHYTEEQLELMSRQELPWQKARIGCREYDPSDKLLADEDIIYFFSGKYDCHSK